MLRGSEKSKSELLRQLEEQEKQLQRYETKLKDVVRAYKSLNAEKEALQATVIALTSENALACTESFGDETVAEDAKKNSAVLDDNEGTLEERVGILKKSLTTLIAEKTRREAAFQADKKALLAENDSLREKIQKAAIETEAQAEELDRRIKAMSAKMKRIEEDRERELTDHGSVLAEMQQRYAKERANAVQMERQIAELYKKLQEQEACSSGSEEKILNLTNELRIANEDKEKWRQKAEKTPTVQILESEIQNLKVETQREVAEIKTRMSLKSNEEREARLHELEERLRLMAEEMGDIERNRVEDEVKITRLQKLNEKLEAENRNLVSSLRGNAIETPTDSADELKEKILQFFAKLKSIDDGINFHELFGFDDVLKDQKLRYEQLQDEYERYKLKAQAVLKSRDVSADFLDAATELPRISSLPTVMECASCANADADLRHTRSVVALLHEKLQTLEIDHANAKHEYEEKCSELHQTIIAMRVSHENLTSEIRQQMQQRVAEMEAEMQKQRTRTLDILAEKEEELEMVKTVLMSVRSQRMNSNDPMDPPQGSNIMKQHGKIRKARSRELADRVSPVDERRKSSDGSRLSATRDRLSSDAESYSSIIDELRIDRFSTQIPAVSSSTEAKNIFYEQELAKKDRLIVELRSASQTAESNARDVQQASVTKDLLHYEMVEKLKEEISILEGKLNFYSGDANMEYLRNIFIQFVHCESSSGRKHILKAIGTVLKLSPNELRYIDRR